MPPEPLKKRTMTLNDLQLRTLNFLRLCRFQLNKAPHEEGMTDEEFIENELGPFETDIYQDRQILKMNRKRKAAE
jgi:hypothetical protein